MDTNDDFYGKELSLNYVCIFTCTQILNKNTPKRLRILALGALSCLRVRNRFHVEFWHSELELHCLKTSIFRKKSGKLTYAILNVRQTYWRLYTQYRNIRNHGVFPALGSFLNFPIFSLLRFLSLKRPFLKFFRIFTLGFLTL